MFLLALSLPVWGQGDQAHEDAVKAGFIYNFIRYNEWPMSGRETRYVRICASASRPLGGQLALLQGRKVHGKEIVVRLQVLPADWGDCQAIFVAAPDDEAAVKLLKQVADLPVLTIGEISGFAERGGMIGLHRVENRIRFDVNQAAVDRAGLKLSSQMLKLADQVWK
jgi:hypothetical protein